MAKAITPGIKGFINDLKQRTDFREIVHHEVLKPIDAKYGNITLTREISNALSLIAPYIKRLYTHQREGIELVRGGKNLVVMTPTASGKSLIYNIPVLESIIKDPQTKALYLFPLKGLEQDQLKALRELARCMPLENLCEIYDGDTTARKREKIRENPPSIVLTNPDMLHLALCAYHRKWEGFFKNLKFVVIDEIHAYRGVLGSHLAQVIRRLRRILKLYNANPVFIASSATIANPGELAETITGCPFEVISESGAGQGGKNFLFLNPSSDLSPYTISTKLFIESVKRGFKTIAFTKTRKITELMHRWVIETAPDISQAISSYRAGFLPEQRRSIEEKLFKGELDGVISTSALELGVDIGGLDVCILVGYPGTVSSTWQRSGRVGRRDKDSLIMLVSLEDALDKYFMRNPEDFFKRSVEAATIDEKNHPILKAHLLCAIAESPMERGEKVYDMKIIEPILNELKDEGKVWYSKVKNSYHPKRRYPHKGVSIRGGGINYRIFTEDGVPLGESDSRRAYRELYPGAIYLHGGSQYEISSLSIADRRAVCAKTEARYYTTPISEESTEIIAIEACKTMSDMDINIGHLRITEKILGYRKKEIQTRRVIGEYDLNLPPTIFSTIGIWFKVDDSILDRVSRSGYDIAGGLHALEHSMIATLPLFALCDRIDLGGVSYTLNPTLESAAVFIYDGCEGGVGLTRRGYNVIGDWFYSTLKLLSNCPCEVSCPSCTQDPQCGNNNEPLDKRGAIEMIKGWVGNT